MWLIVGLNKPKDLIFLTMDSSIPVYLQELVGVRFYRIGSKEDLISALETNEEVFVLVDVSFLNGAMVEVVRLLMKKFIKSYFIIISEVVENSAFISLMKDIKVLLLHRQDKNLTTLISKFLQGEKVLSRKHERVTVHNEVIIKKSILTQEAEEKALFSLKDGMMLDFSRGGARVLSKDLEVKVKDFLNLMYKNKNGKWISVESQVRWAQYLEDGEVLLGVQFIAS